ncbi:MAG TPA: hypothetical protein VF433_12815 [Cellvibrio sp.]
MSPAAFLLKKLDKKSFQNGKPKNLFSKFSKMQMSFEKFQGGWKNSKMQKCSGRKKSKCGGKQICN